MLQCQCGKVAFEVSGAPFLAATCCCDSCAEAADIFSRLPHAPDVRDGIGATPYGMMRKDRIACTRGAEHLRSLRLSPAAKTRRMVATCCNTPVFLEFKGGHWLSVYKGMWPEGARPAITVRTMTGDREDRAALPQDIPNLKAQSLGFFWKLFAAWAAMGFRAPATGLGAPPLEVR